MFARQKNIISDIGLGVEKHLPPFRDLGSYKFRVRLQKMRPIASKLLDLEPKQTSDDEHELDEFDCFAH